MFKNRLLRKIIKPIVYVAGPAAIATAGTMGAGSTTALVLAGTYFGYSLLWVAIYTLPILVIGQDSASRIGVMSGNKGMFKIMDEQIHPLIKWFFLIPIIVLAFVANMGQSKIMVHSLLTILGQYHPHPVLVLICTVLVVVGVVLSVIFGDYKGIEKIMTYLIFFMSLTFLLVSLKGFTEPSQILKGLVPNVPANAGGRDSIQYIAAITAGAVSITGLLSFPYFTSEAGFKREDISSNFRKAILTFGIIFGIWSVAALVSGGSVLFRLPNHLDIENINQAGQVLGPILGKWGVVVFSLGLFCAAYSTFIVVAQLQAYFILDAFRLNWRFNLKNRKFVVIFLILMLLPGLASYFWNFPSLLAIIAAMVLSVLGTPIAIIIVIYLMNKKSFIGEYKASVIRNIILVLGLILTFLLAYHQILHFLNKL